MKASWMESTEFYQRTTTSLNPMSSKTVRAVRVIREKVESSGSESESIGYDEDVDRRRFFLTTTPDQAKSNKNRRTWQKNTGERNGHDRGGRSKVCTHCGSTRHDNQGRWKRRRTKSVVAKDILLKKFFVRAACGEIHESGKCPMEEFFNLIRKWYVPTKHSGTFPPKVEEMLN
uniref:Uncharacterized protein n=1 Tax=Hyaloperonospora arabidopsidis (strain Emoy2) TaxID=559515 RepID=M4B5J3_HYAAE